MAKVFSIFADDRNDHSKMVKQLLSNQVPPIKIKIAQHRPASANPVPVNSKAGPAGKAKSKPTNNPNKDEINQITRLVDCICAFPFLCDHEFLKNLHLLLFSGKN